MLSRSQGIDLESGEGLGEALESIDVVIDVSSKLTQRGDESREFFGQVTRNLLKAEAHAGITHHVALSIVGIDKAPSGYYAGKVLQEELLAESSVPWTLMRATQFHEFACQIYGAVSLGPIVLVPRMICEPVSAAEVAHRLLDLAEGSAAGRVKDFGGPGRESLPNMVRAYARTTGKRAPIVAIPLPGALGRAMRNGSLVAGPNADRGSVKFSEWLADRSVPSRPAVNRA